MKKLLILSGIIFSLGASAQTAQKWENVYGGPGVEEGFGVRCYFNKGYVAVGSSGSLGVSDGYLVRVDTVGLTLWEKFYGGINVDVIRAIRVLPDSGFIMAGYSNSQGYGGYDGWLIRADKNGDTLWTKYIGTSNWDFFYDVYPTWDGGFAIAGGTYGLGMGDEDVYIVKTDANGDTLWTKTYGGVRADEGRGIIQTGDSLLYATGFTNSMGDSLGDIWLLRLDGTGDTLFTRLNGTANAKDQGYGISEIDPWGWGFISGMETVAGDEQAVMVLFLLSDGSTLQNNTFGNVGVENYMATAAYPSGHYGFAGFSDNQGAGGGDVFFKADFNLTTFGYQQTDMAFGMDTAYASGYIVCGQSSSFTQGLPQLYLVKTDTFGFSVSTVGIHELIASTSQNASVYPNPASDKLSFIIPEEQENGNLIEITDMQGRTVTCFHDVNGVFTGTTTVYTLSLSDLENGTYLIMFHSSDGNLFSTRFIVIR